MLKWERIRLLSQGKDGNMSEKRRDNKGRILRSGEAQRTDGKYMYRYTDHAGTRRTVYSWKLVETDRVPQGKRCECSLRDMEKDIQKNLDDGLRSDAAARQMTVDALFEKFMGLRTDLRITTRCNYIELYNTHVRPTIGGKCLCDVKYSSIQRVYTDMVKGQGYSVSTVRSVQAIIYQIFDMAVLDGIIKTNPSSNALKKLMKSLDHEPGKRHALTEEQQSRLVEYVYASKAYSKWGTLFTVLLGTGLRIGEALGLRWCDCDFEKNEISVNHALLYKPNETGEYEYRISEPKTKAGMRVIPMFRDVREVLQEERCKSKAVHSDRKQFPVNGYTDFIFLNSHGKVFTPATVFDAIQNITADYNRDEYFSAEKAGRIPCYLPRFSAHTLRHTFCTRLCENESNLKVIQDVMGHRSIRTTMDVYNEATAEKKQEVFRNLDGKIKVSPESKGSGVPPLV